MHGDPVEGTPSRVLEPYEFGVTQERHQWAWNEVGVCYYCAHCNLALSTLPAERGGHPVRTVDPPLWRGPDAPETHAKCTWKVWKSLEPIPEREYERIGRTKPQLPVIQPRPAMGGDQTAAGAPNSATAREGVGSEDVPGG